MNILSIDPGPGKCGTVVYDTENHRVLVAGDVPPHEVLSWIYRREASNDSRGARFEFVCCEDIVSMGMAVGQSVFDTCKWIGRFSEAFNSLASPSYDQFNEIGLISRRDVKTILAGGSTYPDPITGARKTVTDTVVKRIVKSRFPATGGGKDPAIGTKSARGPLWMMKGKAFEHSWQALAVAIAYQETRCN